MKGVSKIRQKTKLCIDLNGMIAINWKNRIKNKYYKSSQFVYPTFLFQIQVIDSIPIQNFNLLKKESGWPSIKEKSKKRKQLELQSAIINLRLINAILYYFKQMFPNLFNYPLLNMNPFNIPFYPEHFYYPLVPPEPTINHILIEPFSNTNESEQEINFKLTLTKQDLLQQGTGISKKHWSEQQDKLLKQNAELFNFDWTQICKKLPGRNQKMCYSRYRRIQNETKSYWTNQQNQDIKKYFQIEKMSWKSISKLFPNRTAKQIREHYLNFLRPNIKREEWTIEQDLKIIELFNLHGKKWKLFEKNFDGRTENQIKNRFYGRLKRLQFKKQLSSSPNSL